MSQPMIILYDVPSNIPQPWAPNVWRIRLILNYKRLPYRTHWVEFPDVEHTLRAINAPPSSVRPDGRPVYTLPAILDPTHASSGYPSDPMTSSHSQVHPGPVVLAHAGTIAEYLERTYPARPVIPEGARALQTLFVHYISEVFVQPLLPIMVPLSHRRLPPRVQSHFGIGVSGAGAVASFHPQQQQQRHPSLQQQQHQQQQQQQQHHESDRERPAQPVVARREEQWAAVQAQFSFLASVLDKNAGDGDGVVAMGHELTYADFAVCAILIWIEKVAPQEGWARIREWDGGRWGRLWERCKAYMDVF